jgi:hypothetical protein
MKKQNVFATGTAALLLLLGTVLAGCDDSPDDGNDNTPKAPSIGINTAGFDSLTAVTLPGGLSGIKDAATEPQIEGIDDSRNYRVSDTNGTEEGGLLKAFRDASGSIPVTWDNSGEDAAAFWKDETLTNVRADVTLTTGVEDNAYLLVWDGMNTFDIIKGKFFARYVGNSIAGDNGLNKVSSLTFGASAAGTYTVKIAVNKVDGTTGVFVETLAEQTLVFTVAAGQ